MGVKFAFGVRLREPPPREDLIDERVLALSVSTWSVRPNESHTCIDGGPIDGRRSPTESAVSSSSSPFGPISGGIGGSLEIRACIAER